MAVTAFSSPTALSQTVSTVRMSDCGQMEPDWQYIDYIQDFGRKVSNTLDLGGKLICKNVPDWTKFDTPALRYVKSLTTEARFGLKI